MKNSDRCYKPDEIDLEKIVRFSEGSVALYDLLKYCKENKIYTHACCIGHEGGKSDIRTYISFVIDNNQNDMMSYVISCLRKFEFRSFCNISIKKLDGMTNINFENVLIEPEYRELFFNKILDFIKEYKKLKEYNIDMDYLKILDFFDLISSDKTLSIRFSGFFSDAQKCMDIAVFNGVKKKFINETTYINLLSNKDFIVIDENTELNYETMQSLLEFNNSLRFSIYDEDTISSFVDKTFELKSNRKLK